jgi:predicted peroxiredoxin
MKKNLAVLLWAADPERAYLCATPFFHAAAAAAMDANVEIYFTSRSIKLLVRGVAQGLHTGPRQRETVYTFMRQASAHGARFFACSQAMEEYELTWKDMIPEVSGVGGAAAFTGRCLDEAWASVTY